MILPHRSSFALVCTEFHLLDFKLLLKIILTSIFRTALTPPSLVSFEIFTNVLSSIILAVNKNNEENYFPSRGPSGIPSEMSSQLVDN